MYFDQITTIVKSAKTIKTFVEGGDLVSTLREIGGIELDAAVLCLSNSKNAKNPIRELELAIGHLQSAHFTLKRSYPSNNVLTNGFNEDRLREVIERHQKILILMAICYSYLSERILMIESIQRAEEVYNYFHSFMGVGERWDSLEYEFRKMVGFFTAIANPRTWLNMNHSYKIFSKNELEEIRSNLECI